MVADGHMKKLFKFSSICVNCSNTYDIPKTFINNSSVIQDMDIKILDFKVDDP